MKLFKKLNLYKIVMNDNIKISYNKKIYNDKEVAVLIRAKNIYNVNILE